MSLGLLSTTTEHSSTIVTLTMVEPTWYQHGTYWKLRQPPNLYPQILFLS